MPRSPISITTSIYFPEESTTIDSTGKASIATLEQRMKVISLMDAFGPETSAPAKAEK